MKFAKMPEEPEPLLPPSPTPPPEPEPTQSSEESSESAPEDKEAERQEKLTQLQQQVVLITTLSLQNILLAYEKLDTDHTWQDLLHILYLPMYNAHPDFEACKSVSTTFLTTNNFLEKYGSNLKSSSTSMKFNYKNDAS